MSLKQINYTIAENIINLYFALLGNLPNKHRFDKYSYSDMQGYDIVDILNSLHLLKSYLVYKAYKLDEDKLAELNDISLSNETAVINYFNFFIPDVEKVEIDKLDKDRPDYLFNERKIISNFYLSEAYKEALLIETSSSFLDFCIKVKNDNDYWNKVFKRLNLELKTDNKYDKIYKEFNKSIEKEKATENSIVENSDSKITKVKELSLGQIIIMFLKIPIYLIPELFITVYKSFTEKDINFFKRIFNILIFPVIYILGPFIFLFGILILKSDKNNSNKESNPQCSSGCLASGSHGQESSDSRLIKI